MVNKSDSAVITEKQSFDIILDTVCDRLREKRIQHSIKRIKEMEEELVKLEKELDDFIGGEGLISRSLGQGC